MKKFNWSKRFKNKAWLLMFISAIVTFAYTMLSMFGITPSIDQGSIMSLVGTVLTFLVAIGVIVDPTTSGISDSDSVLLENAPVQADDSQIDEASVIDTAESEVTNA